MSLISFFDRKEILKNAPIFIFLPLLEISPIIFHKLNSIQSIELFQRIIGLAKILISKLVIVLHFRKEHNFARVFKFPPDFIFVGGLFLFFENLHNLANI